MDVDDVAGLDERVAETLAGPLPVCREEDHLAVADAGEDFKRQGAGDDGMNVIARADGSGPVGMPVVLNGGAAGENIFKLSLPAMAALIGDEAIEHGGGGGLLQIEVESGLNTESVFMDFVGAKALFELATDFLLEPWGDGGV